MTPAPAIAASTGPYPQEQAWSGSTKHSKKAGSKFRQAAKRRCSPKKSKP